jgi:hypothetical protein
VSDCADSSGAPELAGFEPASIAEGRRASGYARPTFVAETRPFIEPDSSAHQGGAIIRSVPDRRPQENGSMDPYRRPHVRIRPRRRPGHHFAWGGALIAAGVIVLLEQQGRLSEHELWLIAPAALAWSGLVRMAAERSLYAFAAGLARLAVAAYLYVVIEHVGGWTFAATWPVLLIAVGASNIAHALLGRGRSSGDGNRPEEPSW